MKDVMSKNMQRLVETKSGDKAWEDVKKLAGCKEPYFSSVDDYPDQMTVDLTYAASKVSGLSLEDVLIELGGFPSNMGAVHERVAKPMSNAVPPHFEHEEVQENRLLIHYYSERGFCRVLCGLMPGVGMCFNEEMFINETSCKNKGNKHCTMEVSIQ